MTHPSDATVEDHPALRGLLDLEARLAAAASSGARAKRPERAGSGTTTANERATSGTTTARERRGKRPAPTTGRHGSPSPEPSTPSSRDAGSRRAPAAVWERQAGKRPIEKRTNRTSKSMGYQPALDGLRAVSVIGVICYHAGFTWMRGGFFGVEVFFVVSGFLITSLLVDEKETSGGTNLGQFWLRRARRLLPALFTVLVAVAAWAAFAGTDEQLAQLRRDFPWAIFYVGNWGQILGDVPYYAGDPPLLRHLWSLAVEEQWYLLWPLAFVAVSRARLSRAASAQLLAAVAAGSMLLMFLLHGGGPGPVSGPLSPDGVDRVNFMYLSTFTRCSGLLLGAAAAFVWRPWRRPLIGDDVSTRRPGLLLDVAGAGAVGGLVAIGALAVLTEGYVYQWLMALVSVLSLVAVLVAVHPAAIGFRTAFSWRPLVEIGKRSYGLYLWHWPIFVFAKAYHGSVGRVFGALAVAVVLAELCYRGVETPIRKGALGRWLKTAGEKRLVPLAGAAAVVLALVGFYSTVDEFDRAAGGEAVFGAGTTAGAGQPILPGGSTVPSPAGSPTSTPVAAAAPTTVEDPTLRVVIVGDSQAYSLAVNLPDGIGDTFDISNGAVEGCSVYDGGSVRSERDGFSNSFAACDDWDGDWADSAEDAEADVALVVLGAWDVFDLETEDEDLLTFGSSDWDEYVAGSLQHGIDALVGTGTQVALLEVACMRPQDVDGAGVPALPERGDDERVEHVNDLWRQVADQNPGTVTFVEGPSEWCNDEEISSDLGYRWDGVHVYEPGANLIFTEIASTLLDLGG